MLDVTLSPKMKTYLRRCAGLVPHDSQPVHVVDGDAAPTQDFGQSYYIATYPRGNPRIRHPVVVGIDWLRSELGYDPTSRARKWCESIGRRTPTISNHEEQNGCLHA